MKKQSLLVIEDNNEDFHAVVRALNKCGFSSPIHHCESGDEVVEYLAKSGKFQGGDKTQIPELILLDLNLPGMDGKDILVKIREDAIHKRIPVVILTTSKNEVDIYECYERGANSYIEKPVDMEKFLETIKRIKEYWFEINIVPA
jgi:CheY-like chemotaxis protein